MNQQMIQAINQIKSIKNPKNIAIQMLQNASRQGNVMAKGLLNDIEAGNMDSVQNTLTNYMKSQGINPQDLFNNF